MHHQQTSAGTKTKRFNQPYTPSVSISPASVTAYVPKRNIGGRQPSRFSTNGNAKEKRTSASTQPVHRVHVQTLYLILCVVLLNLVVLLCLLHFRILVIVPFDTAPSASQQSSQKLAKNSSNELPELIVNPAEISRPNAASNSVRMNMQTRPQFKNNQAETERNKTDESESPKSREQKRLASTEVEGSKETSNIWETPLKSIGLHFAEKPFEKLFSNSGEHSIDPFGPLPLRTTFCSPCPNLSQIPQRSSQLLADCRAEGSVKCAQWRKAGFCESHPATKWLFCRRQCLCPASGSN